VREQGPILILMDGREENSEELLKLVAELPFRAEESDEEQCGFIVNLDDSGLVILTVRNVYPGDKRHGFEMHPGEQAEIYQSHEVLHVWHTHPTGPDEPSPHDLKFKPPGLRCWVASPSVVMEYTNEEPA
jgi:proteasome lid subunit RPN8/RPN11